MAEEKIDEASNGQDKLQNPELLERIRGNALFSTPSFRKETAKQKKREQQSARLQRIKQSWFGATRPQPLLLRLLNILDFAMNSFFLCCILFLTYHGVKNAIAGEWIRTACIMGFISLLVWMSKK